MTIERAPLVRTITFEKAEEFYKALSPGGKYVEFREKESDFLIFRGHTDSNYRLVPSALRTTTNGRVLHKLSCHWPNDDSEKDSNVLQLLRELSVLRHFFSVADRIGLPLPEDSQQLRT